ncbi:hypothetical protein [Streptosporangium sp. NPDC049644]|uniref:hypothetical protein n=1 Tax=Streptosporangium sp. NPDC049644 TaxID=3155507 RepID=UPI00341EC0E5
MLNELLPGVREIRAPLAAGYLWAALIWLIWGRHLPDASHATDVLSDLYALSKNISPIAIGIAASFLAYLIGILSISLSDWMTGYIENRLNVSVRYERRLRGIKDHTKFMRKAKKLQKRVDKNEVIQRLRETLEQRLEPHRESIAKEVFENKTREKLNVIRSKMRHPSASNRMLNKSGEFDEYFVSDVQTIVIDDLIVALERDLPLVPARLLGHDSELYNVYDRLQAEAQFRAGVALPIGFLSISLGIIVHPAWLLIILPIIAIFTTSLRKRREGLYILAESMLAGRVESPVFERLERITEASLLDRLIEDSDDDSGKPDAKVTPIL